MTDKDVLPEKDLLEKADTMKRFKYSPLGEELKAQTDIANKQNQKLENTFEFEYYNIKNFNSLCLESKYSILLSFYSDLNKLNNLNLKKKGTKEKSYCV